MEALKTRVTVPGSPEPSRGELMLAFRHFTEVSSKLEMRYEHLRRETDELRERLKQKDIEVQRATKLASLGEMAAALAHEVRNPLGAMKLFVSLLKDDVRDRPQAGELLNQMDQSIANLDSVVANILHFSKDKPLAVGPTNIEAVVRAQIAQCQRTGIGESTCVVVVRGSPFLNANEPALGQVIANLLVNASQACRGRGEISIEIDGQEEDYVRISVSDDGCGIPAHILPRIFEPFVSTKNEGTGLGLAVVKQIISQHGGRIEARNRTERRGAEFSITLPRRASN